MKITSGAVLLALAAAIELNRSDAVYTGTPNMAGPLSFSSSLLSKQSGWGLSNIRGGASMRKIVCNAVYVCDTFKSTDLSHTHVIFAYISFILLNFWLQPPSKAKAKKEQSPRKSLKRRRNQKLPANKKRKNQLLPLRNKNRICQQLF